jgi:hypothetical protein
MKKLFILPFAFAVALYSCGGSSDSKETTAAADSSAAKVELYGEEITEDGAVTMSEFLTMVEGKDSFEVKVIGKINQCCKKKGCWMTVDLENGEEMRVSFKDYGFFVPKDADGKTAVFEGWAKVDSISVADQRHYLEDAGASKEEIEAITTVKPELSFVANGVIIK